jgi:hypothetical protein
MPESGAVKDGMETTKPEPSIEQAQVSQGLKKSWGGYAFLGLVIVLVLYGIYLFQIKPLLTMRLSPHQSLAPDSPPIELTSFQIRENSKDLIPQNVAVAGDSICVSFADDPVILVYSSGLKRLGELHLDRFSVITPTAIAVTDSQLIVADTIKGLVSVLDRDGDYVSSVAWYPGKTVRLRPIQLATDGRLLTVVDTRAAQVAVISLISEQPFYDFLELMDLIPGEDRSHITAPTAATITPEGSIWIGDASGTAMIYSPTGDFVSELEKPTRTRITHPVAFAVASLASESNSASFTKEKQWQPEQIRVHLLDRGSGKVYVYDLMGRLKLVYPQDRDLKEPTSIAISSARRQIFVTESGSRSVTVFGY